MSVGVPGLKENVKNYAKKNKVTAHAVLQNYMFERFLARLSQSDYGQNFVLKGGVLLSEIAGLKARTSMNLDLSAMIPSTKDKLLMVMKEISALSLEDGVTFQVKEIKSEYNEDGYDGVCILIHAQKDEIITPLSVNISAGDVITPEAVDYEFGNIFDENSKIKVRGYNIETVMAEKIETLLSQGASCARPIDFYDIYLIETTMEYDKNLLKKALIATAERRGSLPGISGSKNIFSEIIESEQMEQMWWEYQRRFPYTVNVSFEMIAEVLWKLACRNMC